jgi:ankyrin repeat protein
MKKYILVSLSLIISMLLSGCGATIFNAGGNLNVSKQIVADGQVNMRGLAGFTSLHVAAEKGNLEIAKYLIANGAQINAKSNAGYTPIMSALSVSTAVNIKTIEYLIQNGADLNAKDNVGRNVFFWAVVGANIEAVKLLIDKDIKVDEADNTGYTPFLNAAFNGKTEIMKYLIERDVNIDAVTTNGETALILAAWNAKADTVRFLLDNGSDVSVQNKQGETADKKVDIGLTRWQSSTWAQAKIYVQDFNKIKLMLKESSQPRYKAIKEEYAKAKEEDTIRGYETFIASYPNSKEAKKASKLAKEKLDKLNANPERKKEMLDKIIVFLKKKDVNGLLAFANANPDVVEFSRNQPEIYLLFTGPTELQVGKILQYKSKGISDAILASKIKSINKPYRKYSLDEIAVLTNLGLSETILIAMLDVTTEYEKESRQKEAQEYLLRSQEKIAKENKTKTNTVYQNQNTNQNQNSVGNKVLETVAEKALEGLIRNLF